MDPTNRRCQANRLVNREGANLLDGPILYRTRLGSMAVAASMRCLVLNASMEPISVVSAQRGLVLLLKERAMLLERAQAKTTAAKEAAQRIVFKSEEAGLGCAQRHRAAAVC